MRIIAVLLVLTLMLISGCTANVPEPPAPKGSPSADPTGELSTSVPTPQTSANVATHTYVIGVVDKVDAEKIYLKETGSETVTVILLTSDGTVFIDATTGAKASLSGVKAGDAVAAEISIIQAQSMPPQSPTLAVFVNLTEDPIPPRYANVIAIESKENGATWVTTDLNSVWIISAATEIKAYATGAAVDLTTIKVGARLVGWYQIETRSFPSQATPTRVVVLP